MRFVGIKEVEQGGKATEWQNDLVDGELIITGRFPLQQGQLIPFPKQVKLQQTQDLLPLVPRIDYIDRYNQQRKF